MNNLFLTTSLKRVLQSTFILIFLLIFKQNSNAQCSAVSVDLGRDSVYCSNQTLTLNAQVVSPSSSIPTFTWSYNGSLLSGQNSGSLSINLTDTTSGFYSVIAQVDSCIVYDTVNLSIYNIGITSNDFNTAKTQLVYCVPTGDTSGDIFLRLTLPSNISLVQSVEIDWGDGQIQIIPSSNYASPQIHNYLNGFYVFKMTVTLTNGCVSVISYPTFVGNSPSPAALQILNNQADGCFPHFTQYNFNVPSSNPDGTTYEVDWGDGSPLQTYVHPITPPVLSHTFNSSSCGNTVLGNTATYYNRFQPSVITQNPCGSFQPSASGLISVSMPPIASFSTSRSTICPGSLVDFNNTSYFGLSTIDPSIVSCDSVSPFFWRITSLTSSGSSGWSVSPPGNLGSNRGSPNQNQWISGTMAIEVLFDSSGTYKVELIVQTNCGPSIYIDTICVIKPPESAIATTDSIECSPFSFGAYSTSVLPFCDSFNVPVEYAWKVIDPSGCVDCSSSIVDSTSDSTKINLVNRSNVTQDFILELTVTPLDPITLDPLSNLSCESVSYKTVSVYPEIKIDSLTACLGELSWDLDSAVNFPSSFRWRAIPNPNVTGTTTVYQTTTIINDTLKNISDTVQFVYYEVIASSTPGSCLDTQFFSVRLLPDIIITPLVNDSICVGGTINAAYTLQYSGGNNNPTYSWKLNGISQSNNTSSFLPGNFNIVGNYLVEGTVTVGAPGCEISSTDSAIISVFDDPSIIPLLSATYCQAANPVTGLVAQASGGLGTYSYQWYSNNTNDTVGGVKLLNEIDSIYFPSLDSLGTIYYYCVVTQSGLNCMTTSSIATIQVIPQPTIDSNPIVSQEVCVGGILDSLKVSYLNGLGKVSYQWYEDTLGINSGGLLLVGDTFSSFLPQTNIVGIKYYYCEISFSLGGCTNVMSDVSKVTVRPDPIIQTNLSSQTICVGGTIDSALTANYSGGVGSPSYQWNKDGINLPNDTLSSYLPPSFNFLDTFNFGVTISLSGKGCNAVSAQIQTVNVIADPTIIVQPISAVYCQRANSPNLLLVKATGGFSNTYSYQWYSNDTNVIVGSKKIQGATDSVYLPSVDSLGIEYYYCVVSQGGLNCEDTSSIASIHVTPQASIDSNPIVSQEVCVGGGLDSLKVSHLNGLGNVSYQWYEDTTGVNSGGSLLVGDTFSSFLPETTTTGIKYYYCVIYFSSGGCDSITSDVGAVIVRQDPIITQQPLASHTICVGGTIDSALEVNYSGGVGSPSYQWQLNGTDLPSDTLNDYLPPTFVSPGTSIYRVKINLSGRGCNEMISQLVQVDVVSDPSIITQPNSDSYCQGSSPVSPLVINASGGLGVYSYQWYSDTTSNGTGVVLLNGQTDSTFVPPVTMAGTTYYYCVVTQSGLNCDDTSSRAEIIVNPEPTFFTQPIDSQLVCVGGIPDTLSVITQNGVGIPTYQWFVSRVSLSTGGDSIPGAVNSTYVPKADTVGTFYYYCRATFSMGGCSDIVSDLAVINVIPDPQIVNHPADSLSVCIGGSLSTALNVTYSGGIGLPTYFWKFNGGVIPNSDSNFYMPPSFSNLGTNQFSVSIQLSGKGCDIMNSNTSYITVITSPVMELQPISDTVCHKSVTIDTLKVRASNVVGTYNFQWYKNNSSSNFGGTLIMNATDSIYVPSTDSVGTQYYYCRISQSVSNCEVISSAAAVVVNPLPTFLTQPLDSQTVCLDGTPDLLSVTTQNGLGTPSYQWFVTRYVPNTAGDTIYNEVSSSYIPTADSIGTLYYYCVATFSQGGCSNVFSDISVVTVIPDPQISIQPLDSQLICVGGSINPPFQVGYTGGLGKPTYQWKVNGGNIQNTDSSVYLPPTFVNPDTNLFGVTITLSGSGCDVMNSDSAYVIVVPDPVVAIDPLSDTYCLSTGSVNELLVSATGGLGSFNYQWYKNTRPDTVGEILISGATDSTYTPTIDSVGTVYYYCKITQTGLNCDVVTNSAGILVNPDPGFSVQPIDSQIVCLDGTLRRLLVSPDNGVGVPTYQWFKNSVNSIGGDSIVGATDSTYLPLSDSSVTSYYYCEVTYSDGGCDKAISDISVVEVKPDPRINSQPTSSQSICIGGTISSPLTVGYTGGFGTVSYQWQKGNSNIVVGTSSTYLPPDSTLSLGLNTYRVIVKLSGSGILSGCDADTSLNSTVLVVPDPVVAIDPLSDTYCLSTGSVNELLVSATGGLGSFNYQWYKNTRPDTVGEILISGATDSTYTPTIDSVGTVYYYCKITQTGLNCDVVTNSAGILVNPDPGFSVQPIDSQIVCLDGTLRRLLVSPDNGVGVPTYQWFKNSVNSIGGDSIVGATDSTYLPLSDSSVTSYYYCEVTYSDGGCDKAISDISVVEVKPDPRINSQPTSSQSICIGGTISSPLTVGYTGGFGTVSYQWQKGNSNIVVGTSSTYLPPDSTLSLGLNTYRVIVKLSGSGILSGCDADTSLNSTVLVVPDPVVAIDPLSDTYCLSTGSVNELLVSATGGLGSFNYQWYKNTRPDTVGEILISGATDSTYTPTIDSVGTVYYYCKITQTGLNCDVVTNSAGILVNPDPGFSVQPIDSQIVCLDGTLRRLLVSPDNGVGVPTYQWFKNSVNSIGGDSIVGATDSTYLPLSDSSVTSYYYCEVTYSDGGCDKAISDISVVEVKPDPRINSQPTSSQSICIGGTISSPLTVGYTGGFGTVSYQWQKGNSNIVVGTSSTYLPPDSTLSLGLNTYRVIVKLSGSGILSGCDADTSLNSTVLVVPDPVVAIDPLSDTYCLSTGSVNELLVSATGGLGSFNYQWYKNTRPDTVGEILISGATDSTYTPTIDSVGTVYYYCKITQTGLNCDVVTNSAGILVNPDPGFSVQPIDSQIVCLDGTLRRLLVSPDNGVGVPTYQWFKNSVNSIGGDSIVGATDSTYLPLSDSSVTSYYYCEVTYSDGGCDKAISDISVVEVKPDPRINSQPTSSQSICIGGTISSPLTVGYTGGFGTVSYQWQKGNSNIVVGTSSTYLPPDSTLSLGLNTYRVIVKLSGSGILSGCDADTSLNSTVLVVPDPVVAIDPLSDTYCLSTGSVNELLVSATGGLGSFNYQWYKNTRPDTVGEILISGATDSTYTPTIDSVGTVYYYCKITQTGLNCDVVTNSAGILVNPDPGFSVQPIDSQIVCLDGTLRRLLVSPDNGVGVPTYQWFKNSVNSIGGDSIVGATDSTYLPLSDSSVTSYYYCEVTYSDGGCDKAISDISVVEVKPDPRINSQPTSSQSICIGGTISSPLTVGYTGGFGTVSYQWQKGNSNIVVGTSSTYLPPDSTLSLGLNTYRVIVKLSGSGILSGCDADTSLNSTVLVVPDPVVAIDPLSDTYCLSTGSVNELLVSATGGLGSFNYQWYKNTRPDTVGEILISGATDSTYTPTIDSVGTVYYYCKITQTGLNCDVVTNSAGILVNPDPGFSVQPIDSQIVCLDGTLRRLLVSPDNGVGVPTYQWFKNSVNSIGGDSIVGATDSTYLPLSDSSVTSYYYCEVTYSDGGCDKAISDISVVEVKPDPRINSQPTSSQSICIGGTISSPLTVGYTGGFGTVSYQWQKGNSNIVVGTSSTYLPPDSTLSLGLNTYRVIVKLSGNGILSGCDADTSLNSTVLVVPDPVVAIDPLSDTYCLSTGSVNELLVSATGGLGSFNYQWYKNTRPDTVGEILISGATDSTYTPTIDSVGTVYYYCKITQTGLNCDVVTNSAGILVNPDPGFSVQPIDSQIVCLDGTLRRLLVSPDNGVGVPTYQWFKNSVNSIGGDSIVGATDSTYLPLSDSSVTSYYYCEVTYSDGGCDKAISDISVVEVKPDPRINSQPTSSQSICIGGTISSPLTVGYTGGFGTVSYQWQKGNSNIVVGTSSTYLPPDSTLSLGLNTYRVIVKLSGSGILSGCDADTSLNSTVLVVPDPVVAIDPLSDTYCLSTGSVNELLVSATGGLGSFNYQWYKNTRPDTVGEILISGATDSTYTPTIDSVGTVYYYCKITQTGLNCDVVTNSAGILVNPDPGFSVQPIDSQIVCLDGTLRRLLVSPENGVGVPTYQWYRHTQNLNSGGIAISGATDSTYMPLTDSVGIVYYYCEVSFSQGGCGLISSDISVVEVKSDPFISLQPIPGQSICVGGTIGAALTVGYTGGVGVPSYQWKKTGSNLIADTNSSYLPPAFTQPDTNFYSVSIELTGSGCDVMNSDSAYVIVVPDPVVDIQPVSATYCKNTSPVTPLSVVASGGLGLFQYQWYRNTTNSNFGGQLISGEVNSTFTPSSLTVGTVYYYCEITQTGLHCNVTSLVAKIVITEEPMISSQPLSYQKICEGTSPSSLSVSYSGGNNSISYQWYKNTVNSNVGGIPMIGDTLSSFTPPLASAGDLYYYCILDFSLGGCSSLISTVAHIETIINARIDLQPLLSQNICQSTTISQPLVFNFIGGSGANSIQWYQVGSPNVLMTGANDTSFVPVVFNSAGSFKYFALVIDSVVGCNNTTTLQSEIVVNPTPRINPMADTVICNNTRVDIDITSSVPSTVEWIATQNTNVSGEMLVIQRSNNIDDSLTNTTSVPQFIDYTVTPKSFPFGCLGPDSLVTVKVQPDVELTNQLNIEVCSGNAVNEFLRANVPSTFSWFVSVDNPNVTGESLFRDSGNIITDTLVNNTKVNQLVVYSIFPVSTQGACSGEAQVLTVLVKPYLELLNEDTVTICSEEQVNLSLVANTNVTFNWYADQSINVLGESTTVVTSPTIFDTLTNLSKTVQQVNYYVVGTSIIDGCSSPIVPITVFVNPTPDVNPIDDTILCEGILFDSISFSGSVAGTSYLWDASDTTIGIGARNGVNTIPSFVTTNTVFGPITSTFTVTPAFTSNNFTCTGAKENFTISVLPDPSIYPLSDIDVCSGIQVPLTIVSGPVPGTIFKWKNTNTTISLSDSGVGNIPSFNATNLTSLTQLSTVSITPVVQLSGVQCAGAVEDFLITVNPTPDVNPIDDTILCEGILFDSISFSGSVAGTSYLWDASDTTIGIGARNGVNTIPSFVTTNTVFGPITSTFTVTPAFTSNNFTCTGAKENFTISVLPDPSIYPLSDIDVCSGIQVPLTIVSGPVPGTIFKWKNTNTTISLSDSGVGNIPSFNATNLTSSTQLSTVSITPVVQLSGNQCAGAVEDFLITVNPTPDVNPIDDTVLCEGILFDSISFSGSVAGTSYLWGASDTTIGIGARNGVNSTPGFVATNNIFGPITSTFTVTPTFTSNNFTCTGAKENFTISVLPEPSIYPLPDITVCNGTQVPVTNIAGPLLGTIYQWRNSNTAISLSDSGIGNIPSFNATNLTSSTQLSTVSITPVVQLSGVQCAGAVEDFLITVNPTPDVNPIDDTVLCEGILFDSISFSGSVAGTSYLWDASDTTIGISARNGVNSTPGFVATNNIFGPITSMFTITPVYTNNNVTCIGGKENFTISVLPEPSIYPLTDITVCNGTQVPVTNVAGPVSGTIYQWRNSNTAISLSDSGIGNIPSFNATNLTSLTQLSTVSITPVVELSGVQCAGAVEDFLITVNPTPHVVNQDIEICDGESTNIALTSNIPSSFTWFATPNPNVFNETSFPIQVTGVINDNLILVGTSVQTVDYNVVPTSLAHGCIGPDSVVRVKINPLPQVSFTTLNPVLCEDNEIDFFNTSASGLNFTWDFDDGNSSLLVNPKNTFANVGTYIVKLKGVDVITGCSDSVLNPLDILSLPISDFSYSDSLGCDNLEVFFFTDSSNRDWTYSWDFGTGDSSLQYGVAGHYYDTTGCFDVSLKVTSKEGCVSETNSLNPICVYKTPLASFKMDRNTFSTLETALVIFENTSQFENQYVWEFGDGQSSLAENPVNVYPEKAGVYRVKLRVNNFDGCADSTYGIVRVIQDIAVYAPNTFTPNRDDINQVFLPILSEGFDKETYNFKVFNRWGQIVFETRNINEGWNGLCGGNSYINGCPQGTYVWQLSIALEGASEREIYRGHINLIR